MSLTKEPVDSIAASAYRVLSAFADELSAQEIQSLVLRLAPSRGIEKRGIAAILENSADRLSQSSLDEIAKALRDRDWYIRRSVARIFGSIVDRVADENLSELAMALFDEDNMVRESVLRVLCGAAGRLDFRFVDALKARGATSNIVAKVTEIGRNPGSAAYSADFGLSEHLRR